MGVVLSDAVDVVAGLSDHTAPPEVDLFFLKCQVPSAQWLVWGGIGLWGTNMDIIT